MRRGAKHGAHLEEEGWDWAVMGLDLVAEGWGWAVEEGSDRVAAASDQAVALGWDLEEAAGLVWVEEGLGSQGVAVAGLAVVGSAAAGLAAAGLAPGMEQAAVDWGWEE